MDVLRRMQIGEHLRCRRGRGWQRHVDVRILPRRPTQTTLHRVITMGISLLWHVLHDSGDCATYMAGNFATLADITVYVTFPLETRVLV